MRNVIIRSLAHGVFISVFVLASLVDACATEASFIGRFVTLPILEWANYDNHDIIAADPPEGNNVWLGGVPFDMTDSLQYMAPCDYPPYTGDALQFDDFREIDFSDIAQPKSAYILLNSRFGRPNILLAQVRFITTDGLVSSTNLIEGLNVRDYLNSIWVNENTDPNSTEVFSSFGVGPRSGYPSRIDRLQIDFPASWHDKILDRLELIVYPSAERDDGILMIEGGITIETAPEPGTVLMDIVSTADDSYNLYIDGVLATHDDGLGYPTPEYASLLLTPGKHVISVEAWDTAGLIAAFLATFRINGEIVFNTDSNWKVNSLTPTNDWKEVNFDDSDWVWATEIPQSRYVDWSYPAGRSWPVSGLDTENAHWIWTSGFDGPSDQRVYMRYTFTVVPEPGTVAMMATALLGFAGVMAARRRSREA